MKMPRFSAGSLRGAAAVLAAGWIGLGSAGCSGGRDEVAAVRDAVIASTGGTWKKEIELGVGAVILGIARVGLSWAEADADAQDALRSVRGARVSVHRQTSAGARREPARVAAAADRVMAGRGWERMVVVMDRSELVAIYVPREAASARDLQVCVLVLDAREMVVVSARADLDPLLALIERHAKPGQNRGESLIEWAGGTSKGPAARGL